MNNKAISEEKPAFLTNTIFCYSSKQRYSNKEYLNPKIFNFIQKYVVVVLYHFWLLKSTHLFKFRQMLYKFFSDKTDLTKYDFYATI